MLDCNHEGVYVNTHPKILQDFFTKLSHDKMLGSKYSTFFWTLGKVEQYTP